jgi:hypothetical protein
MQFNKATPEITREVTEVVVVQPAKPASITVDISIDLARLLAAMSGMPGVVKEYKTSEFSEIESSREEAIHELYCIGLNLENLLHRNEIKRGYGFNESGAIEILQKKSITEINW